MRTTTITNAKNRLSALIDQVKAGETVVILDRGTPVARLEPVVGADRSDGRLQRLERAGLLRRAVGRPPVDVIRAPGPQVPDGQSAARALIAERREGR